MIRSFADRETEKVWHSIRSRKLPPEIQNAGLRKLQLLNRSVSLNELRVPPANRLEALKGDRRGAYSIRINDQWRVCFIWRDGHAEHVEIVDYHR
jgi:proteic killer suppression protein